MANICCNDFYAESSSIENLETIKSFIEKGYEAYLEGDTNTVEGSFDSKWTFPENSMKELFDLLPDKNDIYMRCLSYEFGCLYHALWVCDENGWREV